jgi:hypothetical protein
MDMDEEIHRPLPVYYHELILRQRRNGTKIIRYGFGSEKLFKKLKGKYPEIIFRFGGNKKRYQRMLVADGKRAMFSLNGIIFYTEFPPLATSLASYVQIIYNKGAFERLSPSSTSR